LLMWVTFKIAAGLWMCRYEGRNQISADESTSFPSAKIRTLYLKLAKTDKLASFVRNVGPHLGSPLPRLLFTEDSQQDIPRIDLVCLLPQMLAIVSSGFDVLCVAEAATAARLVDAYNNGRRVSAVNVRLFFIISLVDSVGLSCDLLGASYLLFLSSCSSALYTQPAPHCLPVTAAASSRLPRAGALSSSAITNDHRDAPTTSSTVRGRGHTGEQDGDSAKLHSSRTSCGSSHTAAAATPSPTPSPALSPSPTCVASPAAAAAINLATSSGAVTKDIQDPAATTAASTSGVVSDTNVATFSAASAVVPTNYPKGHVVPPPSAPATVPQPPVPSLSSSVSVMPRDDAIQKHALAASLVMAPSGRGDKVEGKAEVKSKSEGKVGFTAPAGTALAPALSPSFIAPPAITQLDTAIHNTSHPPPYPGPEVTSGHMRRTTASTSSVSRFDAGGETCELRRVSSTSAAGAAVLASRPSLREEMHIASATMLTHFAASGVGTAPDAVLLPLHADKASAVTPQTKAIPALGDSSDIGRHRLRLLEWL